LKKEELSLNDVSQGSRRGGNYSHSKVSSHILDAKLDGKEGKKAPDQNVIRWVRNGTHEKRGGYKDRYPAVVRKRGGRKKGGGGSLLKKGDSAFATRRMLVTGQRVGEQEMKVKHRW